MDLLSMRLSNEACGSPDLSPEAVEKLKESMKNDEKRMNSIEK